MKKILVALMTVFASACLFGACGEGGLKGKWSASKNSNSESSASSALSGSEVSSLSSVSNEVESTSMSSIGGSSSSSDSTDSSISDSTDSSTGSSSDSSKDSSSDSSFDSSEDNSSDSSFDSSENSSFDSSVDDFDSSNSSSSGSDPIEYLSTDFTAEEKLQMIEYIGMTIPFLPNNEYEVDCYYDEEYEENTVYFCTVGNTAAEFEAYLEKYDAAYSFDGTEIDEEDDTWYYYSKGDVFVDIVYYSYEGEYYMELFAYIPADFIDDDSSNSSSDSSFDSSKDSSFDSSVDDPDSSIGGGDYGEEDVELRPNTGKGLPTSEGGVYEVDFTKAEPVKDVHDQGYYLDGCPTVSDSEKLNILVIPVEFKDVTAASKGYSINKIDKAFNGGEGDTDYYSVREYNYISSYGQLDLNFVVLDFWFRPQQSSSYYAEFTKDVQGIELAMGDQLIMDEALQYLEPLMDLTQFDLDGNDVIDGIVMVNTLEINSETDFQWAYRYWNYYTDEELNYYEYDGVSANDYLWAPYQFLYENRSTGEYDSSLMNTYTFIHEFSHLLGADDYYDTAYIEHPMGGYDIMDAMLADHNPFTKFNYGWLTSSRLIVAEESVTVTLDAFSENGDTIIIANDWAEELGAYQEYYVLMYYKNDGLNAGKYGLFEEEGILVYHVNATLYVDNSYGEPLYDIYNTNTNYEDSNGYGTLNNLIEFITTESGEYVYGVGDSLSAATKNDSNKAIAYTFTVDSITADSATLTFTKNA